MSQSTNTGANVSTAVQHPESGFACLSHTIFRIERMMMRLAIGAILVLIVAGIVMSAFGAPLYWSSEAAVSVMLFATFLGMSMLAHLGAHPAVTLLADFSSPQLAGWLQKGVDFFLLLLALLLIALAWQLFDPVTRASYGSDGMGFAIETGNFTYQEPTNTLGISKAWVWLAPVPSFVCLAIHAAARLVSPAARTLNAGRPS